MFKLNKVWDYLRGKSKPLIAVSVGGLIVVISVVCCRTLNKVRSIESLVESETSKTDSKASTTIKKDERKIVREELKVTYDSKAPENKQAKKDVGQTLNAVRTKKKTLYR